MSNILSVNTQADECPICMGKFFDGSEAASNEKVYLGCSHIFCKPCLHEWRNPERRGLAHDLCPLCRRDIRQIFLIESMSREGDDGIVITYDRDKNLDIVESHGVDSLIVPLTSPINLSRPINPINLIRVHQQNLADALTSRLNTLQAQLEQSALIRPLSSIVGSLQKFPDFMSPFLRKCATAESMNYRPTQELVSICVSLFNDLERICQVSGLSSINSQNVLDHLGEIRDTIARILAKLAPYTDR